MDILGASSPRPLPIPPTFAPWGEEDFPDEEAVQAAIDKGEAWACPGLWCEQVLHLGREVQCCGWAHPAAWASAGVTPAQAIAAAQGEEFICMDCFPYGDGECGRCRDARTGMGFHHGTPAPVPTVPLLPRA